MTASPRLRLKHFLVGTAVAGIIGLGAGTALAHHHKGQGDDSGQTQGTVPQHGSPPLTGTTTSTPTTIKKPTAPVGSAKLPPTKCNPPNCYPAGTVVTDHRNGKTCSYTAGDAKSYCGYLECEGHRHCPRS
jgi:hypothetical protein